MQSELELYFTLQKQQAAGEQGEEEQQQLTATDADNNEYIVNINALPNWIISKILQHLPPRQLIRVERVCKRWQQIAFSISISPWKNFQKFDCGPDEDPFFTFEGVAGPEKVDRDKRVQIIHELLRRIGPFLREFKLTYCHNDTFREIYRELAALYMPNLQFLTLYGDVSSDHIHRIGADPLDMDHLSCIPECTPNLKELKIRCYDQEIDADILGTVLNSLPNLQAFSCFSRSINVQQLGKLPAGLKKLQWSIGYDEPEVLQQFLALSASNCTNLAELDIRADSEGVYRELAKFKCLESLRIDNGYYASAESPPKNIPELGDMRMLQHIYIYAANKPFLRAISQCRQLKIVQIYCIKDCDISELSALGGLRQLRGLELEGCKWIRGGRVQFEFNEMLMFRDVLKGIAERAPLEYLLVDFFAPAEFLANSLFRPCKTLSTIWVRTSFKTERVCEIIEELAEDEGVTTAQLGLCGGGATRRQWPVQICCELRRPPPPCQFIRWREWSYDGMEQFQTEMVHKFCPSHRMPIPKAQTLTFSRENSWRI